MNLTCWLFGHKWEDIVRISAKNKKWGRGKIVICKCQRCGKIEEKYEADIEPTFPCDVEITPPSITRKLNEYATLELIEAKDDEKEPKEPNKKVSKPNSSNKK